MILTDPARLWYLSTRCHARGWVGLARIMKMYNFIVFRAVLPPEAILAEPVTFGHYALNVVVHPNVSIGKNVRIWHGVTLSVSDTPGTASRLVIGNNVTFGAGAIVVTRERAGLSIASSVSVGANSVVTGDLCEAGAYAGAPAKLLTKSPKSNGLREGPL